MIRAKRIFNLAKDHSGTLCAIGAIVGVAVTAYLSGKAAVKTYTELDPDTDKKLKVKVYTKNYLKVAVSFAATIGLIIGSDRIHVRKEMAIAGIAALWKEKYADLHKEVANKYGEDAARELDEQIAKNHMRDNPYVGRQPNTDKGEKLVYEPYTDQYFITTDDEIREVYYLANKQFQKDFELPLNFIIRKFGGDTTKIDDKFGWYYESETQQYGWGFYGCMWIEPTAIYMSSKDGKQPGPLKYLKHDAKPEANDIRCLFYDVEPMMPFEDDMLYKEEC